MEKGSWKAVTPAGKGFAAAVAEHPGEVLLAFDFDGTLAPIVDNPEDARLHEGTADALAELGQRLGQVAIITGRPVDAVRRLGRVEDRPGLERLVVLGQYGVERYDVATGEVRSPETPANVTAALHEVRALLEALEDKGIDTSGIHVEDKGRALAVHTRRHPEPEAALEKLKPHAYAIAGRHGLHVEPGRLVWELRNATHDKGDALRELVDEVSPRFVAFAGDDLGDLPAFEAMDQLRSEGIRCCAVVSCSKEQPSLVKYADVQCGGPDGVAAWLNSLRGA